MVTIMRFFSFLPLFFFIVFFSFIFLSPEIAMANTINPFAVFSDKTVSLFTQVKTLVFILGGFGLIGLAVPAIFGKINWQWFAGLGFGLLIVSLAGSIISHITDYPFVATLLDAKR